MKKLLLLSILPAALALQAAAQNYSIPWHKIAGGGGTSNGGSYALQGTIGQSDASGPMTGGGFTLAGGFWAITAVATAGAPNLVIVAGGPGNVTISWAGGGAFTLQQTTDLGSGNWAANTNAVSSVGGSNSVSISPPLGNVFFRLKQ